ncbi:unnamed protein product [Auanema sp. JU1783]|nr:unnamed protein product [Auanema sp. JU1783]
MAEKGQHPAVQSARPAFRFLRKGSGSQLFDKKISYIKRKSAGAAEPLSRPPQPVRNSETSSVLSDNVFRQPIDVEPHTIEDDVESISAQQQYSQRNISSPVQIDMPKRSDLDSGRGSGNTPPGVYKAHNRPDSGYSEFDAVSPNRSEAQESEVTVASRIAEEAEITLEPVQGTIHEKTVVSVVPIELDDDVATEDQSVAQHDFRNDTESFIQKELDVDDARSVSPRSRNIRAQIERNVPCDRDSVTNLSDKASTLSSFSSQLSRPLPQHSGVQRDTPIFQDRNFMNSDRSSSGVPSPTIDVQRPSTASSGSTGDIRKFVAARDKPLHVAFPPNLMETQKRPTRDKIRPSESTRFPVAIQTDNLDDYSSSDITSVSERVRALKINKNKNNHRNEIPNDSPISVISSVEAEPATPYMREHQGRTKPREERIRYILEKQLRDAIIHTDIARQNMQKQSQKMSEYINELDEAAAKMRKEREFFEEEKEKHRLEALRSMNQIRKDREALIKREKLINQDITNNQTEAKDAIHKASISKAEIRTKLTEKENLIKELKAEIEKLKKSNERLDNIVKQKEKRMNSTLKNKDAIINRLTSELNALTKTTKRNGLTPRSKMDSSDVAAIQRADPIIKPVSRRQVHFNDTTDTTVYLPEDTFSPNSSTNSFREAKKWILKNTVNLPKKGICYTYCCREPTTDLINEVGVFDLRHVNGRMCGAKLYQYSNSDCRFIYGPLEIYYYGHTRLLVTLHGIDVKIRCFQDEVEIIRPRNEISKYNYKSNKLIETRCRRDNGMYSIGFDCSKMPNVMERHGHSDRTFEEDRVVLRRGSINDMLEHVIVEPTGIRWKSHHINAAINEWDVYAHPTKRQVKIQVELGTGEPYSILFCPSYDWVYIRHLDVLNPSNSEPCCDMGSSTRRRERNQEYCSVGEIVKT